MVLCLAVEVGGFEIRAFGDMPDMASWEASRCYFEVSQTALRLADYVRVPQLRTLQVTVLSFWYFRIDFSSVG
jgi:hypothetical protein